VKYAWIDAQRREYPRPDMCAMRAVSIGGPGRMGQRRLKELRGQRNWPRLRRYGIAKKNVAP